jgi:anaerobic ribonucleoside-triphosphate reductase
MLTLIRIKACNRCGGDVSLECDIYGVYAECIQCGATWYQKAPKLRFVNNEEMSVKAEKAPLRIVSGNKK